MWRFTFTGSKSPHFHLSLFYHSFHSSIWRNSKPPTLITNTLSSIHTIDTLLSFPNFHLNHLCPKEWTHHRASEDLSIISSNEHYRHLHQSSIHVFPLFNPLSINPTPQTVIYTPSPQAGIDRKSHSILSAIEPHPSVSYHSFTVHWHSLLILQSPHPCNTNTIHSSPTNKSHSNQLHPLSLHSCLLCVHFQHSHNDLNSHS